MGTGRKFNKNPVTRPKKKLRERKRREKAHANRLMAMGIPEEDLPHIGTWLYRGSNTANLHTVPAGLGISLHTARRIIEAHGGALAIESQLGQGTRVTITLPAFVRPDRA